MDDKILPADLRFARANPMIWENEEPAQGVFVGAAEAPDLLGVPAMRDGAAPRLPADFQPTPAIDALLDAIAAALAAAAQTSERPPAPIDLTALTSAEREAVGLILGDGEVSIVAGREPIYQISESVLTGVWRIRCAADDGSVLVDEIEVAPIPSVVRAAALSLTGPMPPTPEALPDGVMNVGPVLAEIGARAEAWRPGRAAHVLNFTLFPMTEADTEILTRTLGEAPLTVVSGGFGACRIMATRVRHVWAVQYENAMGKPILDTVEIGDIPEVACAAPEDFESSARRLATMTETYRS